MGVPGYSSLLGTPSPTLPHKGGGSAPPMWLQSNLISSGASYRLPHAVQHQAVEPRGEGGGIVGQLAVEDLRLLEQQQRQILDDL